jgi:hypothetical protein
VAHVPAPQQQLLPITDTTWTGLSIEEQLPFIIQERKAGTM